MNEFLYIATLAVVVTIISSLLIAGIPLWKAVVESFLFLALVAFIIISWPIMKIGRKLGVRAR